MKRVVPPLGERGHRLRHRAGGELPQPLVWLRPSRVGPCNGLGHFDRQGQPANGRDGKLQDHRSLALTEVGQKDDLTIREFQSVMMCLFVIQVEPAKTRQMGSDAPNAKSSQEGIESAGSLRLSVERQFGAWQETDRNRRMADFAKPARRRTWEAGANQTVARTCRPRLHAMQTIITHRCHSLWTNHPGFGRLALNEPRCA